MRPFSIQFGELRYKNVNNTFMHDKTGLRLKTLSVAHTLGKPCYSYILCGHRSWALFDNPFKEMN